MTFQDLRELRQKRPFEPFDIHLADGRALSIDQPEFLGRSVDEQQIVVGRSDGVIETIEIQNVLRVTIAHNNARRSKRGR